MIELVGVAIGGRTFTAWTRVMWRASLKEAARSWQLDAAVETRSEASHKALPLFATVKIVATKDPVIVGYIDRKQMHIDATSARVTLYGRSRGADAIDCSVIHDSHEFRNMTLVDIAHALDKSAVGYTTAAALTPIPLARAMPGETQFRFLDRLAREQGLTLMGSADGGIEIVSPDKPQRHKGELIEGLNILVGDADHNGSNRFSEVRVLGQRGTGSVASDLELEAIAQDQGVSRYRPLVVIDDRGTDAAGLKKRAKQRRDRSAGEGLSAQITVVGWRDEAGTLWTPGRKIWVESAFLDLKQDMLLKAVTATQDGTRGEIAVLDLVDPRAFGAAKSKANKSGAAWSIDDSEATS